MKKHMKKILAILIAVCISVIPSFAFAEDFPTDTSTGVTEHCYDDNSHSMPLGDVGKWFDTKEDFIKYYQSVVDDWNNKVDSGQISNEEYSQNVPMGYECWSCSYCGKWTGNFKYNKRCQDDNSHSKEMGDVGQWFNSLDELDAYVEGIVNDWADRYNRGEISKEEYEKNAPNGYTAWSCAYCGKWTGNFKYYPAHEEVDDCQHEWAYMELKGTSHYKYCIKCAEIVIEPCTYSTAITSPTCTEQGYTTYTCIYCGATMTGDFTPATGHNYSYVSNNDGTHYQVCANCGNKTANENCVRTVVDGKTVCKDCGYVFEEVTEPSTDEPTQHTHTWDNGTVLNEATCTEKGAVLYRCTECGATRTVYVDELGHDYVATVTEPTCTEDGYTTYKCSRCGNSYVSNYVDATGHSLSYVSNGDGTHHQECSKCGYTTANEICVKTTADGKTVCEKCGYVFETITDKPTDPTTDPTTEPTTDKPTEPSTDEPSEPDTETSTSEPTSDTDVTEKPSEMTTEPSEDTSVTTANETESTVTTASSEDSSTTQNNDTSEKVTDADIPDTGNSYNCAWIYGAVLGTVCVVTIIILKNKTKKHDLKHDEIN